MYGMQEYVHPPPEMQYFPFKREHEVSQCFYGIMIIGIHRCMREWTLVTLSLSLIFLCSLHGKVTLFLNGVWECQVRLMLLCLYRWKVSYSREVSLDFKKIKKIKKKNPHFDVTTPWRQPDLYGWSEGSIIILFLLLFWCSFFFSPPPTPFFFFYSTTHFLIWFLLSIKGLIVSLSPGQMDGKCSGGK